MNINAVLPIISAISCTIVIVIVVARSQAKTHKVFVSYLGAILLWSLGSFIIRANFFPNQTIILLRGMLLLVMATVVFYYQFTRAFLNRPAGLSTYLGYAGIVAFAIFVNLEGAFGGSYVVNGGVYYEEGASFYLASLFVATFCGLIVFYLVHGYKAATDPYLRNKIGYLLATIPFFMLFIVTNFSAALGKYSVDIAGNLASTFIISYVILRSHLLDITFVIRRALAFFLTVACIGVFYAGMIYLYYEFLPDQPFFGVVLFLASSAVLLTLAAQPLRLFIQKIGLIVKRWIWEQGFSHCGYDRDKLSFFHV